MKVLRSESLKEYLHSSVQKMLCINLWDAVFELTKPREHLLTQIKKEHLIQIKFLSSWLFVLLRAIITSMSRSYHACSTLHAFI